MTHYEERLEKDLARIREKIAAVAERVELALRQSVYALLANDTEIAYKVVLGDLPINRAIREIDRRCHAFVARHLPSAGHLRFISSALRLVVELERIGDYAASIGREATQLSGPPPNSLGRHLDLMADQTRELLHQAVKSFLDGDAELARSTKQAAYQLDRTYDTLFDELIEQGDKGARPLHDLFALLVVFNRVGRVCDQAKNICEDTLFWVAGETKQPKVYRVLFVDERNDCASQIAEAIARKAYPNSGEYDSAGWNPAGSLNPAFLGFMENKGHDLAGAVSSSLVSASHELNDYHVVVSLDGDIRQHIPQPPPFNTIFLKWGVDGCPENLAEREAEVRLDEIYKQIAGEVEDLMQALRGEDAD